MEEHGQIVLVAHRVRGERVAQSYQAPVLMNHVSSDSSDAPFMLMRFRLCVVVYPFSLDLSSALIRSKVRKPQFPPSTLTRIGHCFQISTLSTAFWKVCDCLQLSILLYFYLIDKRGKESRQNWSRGAVNSRMKTTSVSDSISENERLKRT